MTATFGTFVKMSSGRTVSKCYPVEDMTTWINAVRGSPDTYISQAQFRGKRRCIAEIDSPNTSAEHALTPTQEHGFLWRLNTYWSYEERDGGLYLQIEAVSLTRSIPTGLAWAIRPYIESIPRESLEFTLRSACNAIRKQ